MGNSGAKARQRRPTEEKSVPGLLSLSELTPYHFDIKNLAFANCGADGFSYVGGIRVLEKLYVLPKIRRFSGVGNGAVFATFLAIGLDSNELQVAFGQHLLKVQADEINPEHSFESYTQDFGWNSGKQFMDWFGELLESKSFDSDLTFLQLYEKTGKELCFLVTNVDKRRLEYLHPKTSPDLSIKKALFMAISVPGIFIPQKYGSLDHQCSYVGSNLICSYPIHCFDGWFLSMARQDSFAEKLESPEDFYHLRNFDSKNRQTVGFLPLNRHQEEEHEELQQRLIRVNADLSIPRTTLGLKFQVGTQVQQNLSDEYSRLKNACSIMLSMVKEMTDCMGIVSMSHFVNKVVTTKSLSKSDRLFFPEMGRSSTELIKFLETMFNEDFKLPASRVKHYIQMKMIVFLNQYSNPERKEPDDLHSYFGTTYNDCVSRITDLYSNYNRTIGILCRHIGSQDVDFENEDQTFLYRQGWNATVCCLQFKVQLIEIESSFESIGC